MTRDAIYQALFDRVKESTTFRTVERRIRHWSDVPVEDMPYLGMAQDDGGAYVRTHRLPAKITFNVSLYIYVHTGAQQDKDVVPAALLNPILDAVDEALSPKEIDDNRNLVNTLGGLVHDCRISGLIETSEGMLGDLEYAIIPIEIVVPS